MKFIHDIHGILSSNVMRKMQLGMEGGILRHADV
jgi:hypothetical protein